MSNQTGNTNDNGVILSAGLLVNGDRCVMVMPLLYDGTMDPVTGCVDAVAGFVSVPMAALIACLSSDAELTYVQAEGMVDGVVPYRTNFEAGSTPGTLSAGAMSSQVGALLDFYADPADLGPGDKMAVARNTIPGIPKAEVAGDTISGVLKLLVEAFGATLQPGFLSSISPPNVWQRCLSVPVTVTPNPLYPPGRPKNFYTRPAGQNVRRTVNYSCPGYVATIRKRLTPR